MNRRSIHITIPKPCHKRWDAMDARERGAFCHSCQKEVIDFSAMTDREVIEYLERHQTGCGRFRKDQLDTTLRIPEVQNGLFKWRALFLGLFSFAGWKSAIGLPYPQVISTDQTVRKAEKKDSIVAEPIITLCDSGMLIRGKVIDEKGEVIIYADVMWVDSAGKSTGKGVMTGLDGNFSLSLSKDELDTNVYRSMKISTLGYVPKIIQLSDAREQSIFILLKRQEILTGDVIIVTGKGSKPISKIKYWFHRTFRTKQHR